MKDESSSRESAESGEDRQLAQQLQDEGTALGRPHAHELAERILAARSARPAHGGWPIGRGHARPGGPLASAARLRLAGAAVLLTVAMVGCVMWLHRPPPPASQPGVDVLSQLSLGGLKRQGPSRGAGRGDAPSQGVVRPQTSASKRVLLDWICAMQQTDAVSV